MTYKHTTQAGFAPLGALIAGLVALGVLGGGAAYQYQQTHRGELDWMKQMEEFRFGERRNDADHTPGWKKEEPDYDKILSYRAGELSEDEKNDLLFMREEEKLARDVYLTLYDKWQAQIFERIAASEQRHALAVKALLDRYNLADPTPSEDRGSYSNGELVTLYQDLVARGSQSYTEALKVGALIEDLDIADLQEALGRTDNEDITMVYENLMRASRNHLRSFTKELAKEGESYTPSYISQEAYEAIINSDMERGDHAGEDRQMHGRGQGQGRGMMQNHRETDDYRGRNIFQKGDEGQMRGRGDMMQHDETRRGRGYGRMMQDDDGEFRGRGYGRMMREHADENRHDSWEDWDW